MKRPENRSCYENYISKLNDTAGTANSEESVEDMGERSYEMEGLPLQGSDHEVYNEDEDFTTQYIDQEAWRSALNDNDDEKEESVHVHEGSVHGQAVHGHMEPSPSSANGVFVETFLGAAQTYGTKPTLLEEIHQNDTYSEERKDNLFYPFSSEEDWEVAAWLSGLNVSMKLIDGFFKLKYVSLLE